MIELSRLNKLYIFIMSKNYDFEDDYDGSSSPSKNKTKEIADHLNDMSHKKFIPGTISKGFFIENIEEQEDVYSESPNKSTNNQKGNNGKSSATERQKQTKLKKQLIRLEPLKQKEKVEVFNNVIQRTDQYQEIQSINMSNKKEQSQPRLQNYEQGSVKKRKTRRNYSKKLQLGQVQKQENQLPKIQQKKEISARGNEVSIPQQQQSNELQQDLSSQNPLLIPQRSLPNQLLQQFDEDPQVIHENHQLPQRISVGSNYFNFHQNGLLWKQLFQPVQENKVLSMQIVRDKEWLNNFWPEFHLHIKADTHYVISAKKKSIKPISTFVISANRTLFDEDTLYYLGKMKSMLVGNIFNIFGSGPSPSTAQQKNQTPRQLLCTIVYQTLGMFEMGKPRQLLIYLKKPEYRYYGDFPQVTKYEQQIPLSKLYQNAENKQKIQLLQSRKPVWQQQIKGYMLNFKGKVDLPSVKNFIVEQSPNGPELIIFGKISENKFNLDVSYPFSPYVGFALALSSFDRE